MFDPRYLLLTSKERKQVFEQYVKERAEEERREKRNKLKEKKEQFKQLLDEAHLTSKYDEPASSAVIHSFIIFISGMHHYECVAPSVATFRERFIDFRYCWVKK